MNKKLSLSSICITVATTLMPVLLLSTPAFSQECIMQEDATLLAIDSRRVMFYWNERPCSDGGSYVRYQLSFNRGRTWEDEVHALPSVGDGIVEEFDGIYKLRHGRPLIAPFAVQDGNRARILVMTSSNARDWTSQTVLELDEARFTGCPALDLKYEWKLGVISLMSTIETDGEAHTYLVISRDGGRTWDEVHQLAQVPTECED